MEKVDNLCSNVTRLIQLGSCYSGVTTCCIQGLVSTDDIVLSKRVNLYKIYLVVLIICIENISPTPYEKCFTPHKDKLFLSNFNCEHWDKERHIMSNKINERFIDTEETHLNPLVTLAHILQKR